MGWWVRLSAREKRAVFAATVLILLVVYYLGFWSPLSRDRVLQQKVVAQLEADYRHMVQAGAELRRLRAMSGGSTALAQAVRGVSLLAQVDSSLQRGGLAGALQEIKPDGEKNVRVSLRKSPFERVVLWLDYLRSNGIEVARASFNADDEPGYVQVNVQLRDQRR